MKRMIALFCMMALVLTGCGGSTSGGTVTGIGSIVCDHRKIGCAGDDPCGLQYRRCGFSAGDMGAERVDESDTFDGIHGIHAGIP